MAKMDFEMPRYLKDNTLEKLKIVFSIKAILQHMENDLFSCRYLIEIKSMDSRYAIKDLLTFINGLKRL